MTNYEQLETEREALEKDCQKLKQKFIVLNNDENRLAAEVTTIKYDLVALERRKLYLQQQQQLAEENLHEKQVEIANEIQRMITMHDRLKHLSKEVVIAKRIQQTKDNVAEIKRLFERYVPSKKMFDANAVIELASEGIKLYYKYDGVEINYHGRMTFHNDDYDYFVEREVRVDGVLVHQSDQ